MSDAVLAGDGGRFDNTIVAATGTDYGTSSTSGGSANTKSAWTQISAALATPAVGGFTWAISTTTGVFDFAFDLGVGTAGNEVIVVPNLFFTGAGEVIRDIFIPMQLPAGVPISVRAQSHGTSRTSLHCVRPFLPGWLGSEMPQRCESLGVVTSAATTGTSVTPSATINTKGSWATIGTTSFDWRYILILTGYQQSGARTGSNGRLDIGIGTGPTILLPDLRYRNCNTSQEPTRPNVFGPFPVGIPSGKAISARASCSAASALALDVALLGFGG